MDYITDIEVTATSGYCGREQYADGQTDKSYHTSIMSDGT